MQPVMTNRLASQISSSARTFNSTCRTWLKLMRSSLPYKTVLKRTQSLTFHNYAQTGGNWLMKMTTQLPSFKKLTRMRKLKERLDTWCNLKSSVSLLWTTSHPLLRSSDHQTFRWTKSNLYCWQCTKTSCALSICYFQDCHKSHFKTSLLSSCSRYWKPRKRRLLASMLTLRITSSQRPSTIMRLL